MKQIKMKNKWVYQDIESKRKMESKDIGVNRGLNQPQLFKKKQDWAKQNVTYEPYPIEC